MKNALDLGYDATRGSWWTGPKVFGQGRPVLLLASVCMITGCAVAAPRTPDGTGRDTASQRPCTTRLESTLSTLAGLGVATGQAVGAAVTGDLAQGHAALLTVGTVLMPDPQPVCTEAH